MPRDKSSGQIEVGNGSFFYDLFPILIVAGLNLTETPSKHLAIKRKKHTFASII